MAKKLQRKYFYSVLFIRKYLNYCFLKAETISEKHRNPLYVCLSLWRNKNTFFISPDSPFCAIMLEPNLPTREKSIIFRRRNWRGEGDEDKIWWIFQLKSCSVRLVSSSFWGLLNIKDENFNLTSFTWCRGW